MKVKIISTSDGKYEGETLHLESISDVGSDISYKGTVFELVKKTVKGNLITLYSPNYIVKLKVIG